MARYIDADVLSDAVIQSKNNNRHSDTVLRLSHDNEHRHFLAMIDAAPTADISPDTKWISVKERLPDESGDYLTLRKSGICAVLGYSAKYHAFNSCDNLPKSSLKYRIKVTHWMPLPAAPKEEGENT